MASALAHRPQEALLWALKDLEESSFKTLKFHLRDLTQPRLARGELEGLSQVDLAARLISMYGAQEAVRVVMKVLQTMNLLELVDYLRQVCLNDYREIYREQLRCLQETQDWTVSHGYSQLLLLPTPESSSESPASPSGPDLAQEPDLALFGQEEETCPSPSTVVLQGSAGTGKTTLVKKLVQDWASGTLYAGRFDYVFYVSCREVVLLPHCDLPRLIRWCCRDDQAPVTEILRQPERLLFILDGYDELQRPFEGQQRPTWRSSRVEHELHLLIRGKSLPACSLLITTRPAALRSLEPVLGARRRHVHILGFTEEQRKRYFSCYFTDEERARRAFEFVKSNAVLFKACQVPGICWVVCSWLKGKMERGEEISEAPSNSTDIFTAYVATFLPKDGSDEDSSELTRHRVLKGLCALAAEGTHDQRLLFGEDALQRHNLDGPGLAAFLNCSHYQEGLGLKKLYSFRHISFQEFFYAMSFLVKEETSQLGVETRRKVDRLVKEQKKYKEMTLSTQFLFDILKTDSSLNLGLKFCLRIDPAVMGDLKRFKEQIESIKHNRTWDLEFSLYNSKIKKFTEGIHLEDILLDIRRVDKKTACIKKKVSFRVDLAEGQKETPNQLHLGKYHKSRKPKVASNGKSRGADETDQDVRGSREKETVEMKGQEGDGEERQEDGEEWTVEKDEEMRDQTSGSFQKERGTEKQTEERITEKTRRHHGLWDEMS